MRKLILPILASGLLLAGQQTAAPIAITNFLGASAPYALSQGFGEFSTLNNSEFYDVTGRTYKSVAGLPSTSALVVVAGQSLAESIAPGTYSTVSALNWNFNIGDRGVYNCTNPVLGTPLVPAAPGGSNSLNCQIGDLLISHGTYTNVIVAPIAVGGTSCADWDVGGRIHQRIFTLYNGLASRGLTKASGFPGDVWILWHDGETDGDLGTPRATLATCLRAVAGAFSTAGFGTTRFFVSNESVTAFVVHTNVTLAQGDVVASGCSTCRQGMNVDQYIDPVYRVGGGTHPSALLATAMATDDVTVITNCKNTSC